MGFGLFSVWRFFSLTPEHKKMKQFLIKPSIFLYLENKNGIKSVLENNVHYCMFIDDPE